MTVTPAVMPGARPSAPKPITGVFIPDATVHPLDRDPGAIPVDAPLTPPTDRPSPLVVPPRSGPLHGLQYLRREALRLSIEFYRESEASDSTVLRSADRFAEFIRYGTITTP